MSEGCAVSSGQVNQLVGTTTGKPASRAELHAKKRGLGFRWLKEILIIVVSALIVAVVVRLFVVQVFYVPSSSMEDTLQVNDRIAVSKLPGSATNIERGDVIVFTDDRQWMGASTTEASWWQNIASFLGLMADPETQVLVKRVIGVGGDTISCDGAGEPILVNGVAIEETYLADGVSPSVQAFSVTVPEGYYWVMGDNRSNSADSRAHLDDGTGFISQESVIGRVVAVIWPVSNWATVGHREVFADVPDAS